jgi:hypothetical protein
MRKLTSIILSTTVLVSSVSFAATNAVDTTKPAVEMKQPSKEAPKVVSTTTTDSKAVANKSTQIATSAKEAPKAVTTTKVKAEANSNMKSNVVHHKATTKDTLTKQVS